MKRKRFSVEQIAAVLKQAEISVTGCGTDSASGDHGADPVSLEEAVKGLQTDQVLQFKQLQEENGRLKRLVAELTLDKVMLKDVLAKNPVTPSRRRPVMNYLHDTYRVSGARAVWRVCRSRRVGMKAGRNRGQHCGCGFGRSPRLGFQRLFTQASILTGKQSGEVH